MTRRSDFRWPILAGVLLLVALGEVAHPLINNPIRTGISEDGSLGIIAWSRYALFFACCFASFTSGALYDDVLPALHLLVYAGIALASAFWSVDPATTFKNSVMLFGAIASFSILRRRMDDEAAMQTILMFLMGCMIASALVAVAWPEAGRHGSWDFDPLLDGQGKWRGIFIHKNALGAYAAVAVSLLLPRARPSWSNPLLWRLAQLCAVACLVLSGSANAVLGALLGVAIQVVIWNKRYFVPMIFALLVVTISLSAMISLLPTLLAEVMGRDATFTGRTDIWMASLALWSQSPLLGFGYVASSDITRPYLKSMLFDSAVDPHDAYINILLDVGILGLCVFVWAVAVSLRKGVARLHRQDPAGLQAACMSVMVIGLVMSIGEVSPLMVYGNAGQLFWWALLAMSVRGRAPELQRIYRVAATSHSRLYGTTRVWSLRR